MKRVFLIVLDSFGVGEMPDAANFGDFDVNTIKACASSKYFNLPNMGKMGLFNIDGVEVGDKVEKPIAKYCRLKEASMGKDTVTGHWEIAGIVSPKPMPTFPDGFPQEFLDEFSKKVGRGVLCNLPYSGTAVINDYGDEHMKTGDLICYTSADSVFQIAAHEDLVPPADLYKICHIARDMLTGDLSVGRVIARPFIGTSGNYTRTTNRHDYALEPASDTLLDVLKKNGKDVLAVGKIYDIFAGRGATEFVRTTGNEDGIDKTIAYFDKDFEGLCFVNLVDFDMLYGHRRDIDGYAKALTYFDEKLGVMMDKMRDDDIIMITADHGCDPSYEKTTDHTREYIPLLMYGKNVKPENMGTRQTFSDIAATVLDYLKVESPYKATSLL